MTYNWDETGAKRDRRWRLAIVLMGTCVTVGVPTIILMIALHQ